jgi:hypothetical protein
MTEIEALTKMDILFDILKTQKDSLEFNEILLLVQEKDSLIDDIFLKMGLYKLQEDNYAYELKHQDNKKYKIYSVSIKGSIFHGYVKQKEIEDLNQTIFVQNEMRIVRNEKWLTRGTWFAGIAALLLLLWQVFLYFYPVHADYSYWIWQTIPKTH